MVECIISKKGKCILKKPEVGDTVETEFGKEEVVEVLDYDETTEDMDPRDRESFDIRVEHFLGDKNRYFEYLTRLVDPKPGYEYAKGNIDSHDWSEWPNNFPRKKKIK